MVTLPLIIGNWKMSLTQAQTGDLAVGLKKDAQHFTSNVSVAVAPSSPYIDLVARLLKGSGVSLAAQNVFWEPVGAYTGEVSAPMLTELGCRYVIIGHSERRRYLRETDHMVHRKVQHALAYNLTPVICIGETFDERQQGTKELVLMEQLQTALEGVVPAETGQIVVAYEPVWAVGTGQACDPAEARETIQALRHTLVDMYRKQVAEKNFTVLYGGSVDETNIASYVDRKIIDGVLVGGASAVLEKLLGMIRAVSGK